MQLCPSVPAAATHQPVVALSALSLDKRLTNSIFSQFVVDRVEEENYTFVFLNSGKCWFLQSGNMEAMFSSQCELPYKFPTKVSPSHPHGNLMERNSIVFPSTSSDKETLERTESSLGVQILTGTPSMHLL